MYLVIYGLLNDPISSLSPQQLVVRFVYNELERMLRKNCIMLTFAQIHTTM
jgi:YD repeat-containing protein